MKITHIAAAAAVPAAIAGAVISFGAAGHATAGHPAPARTRPAASGASARATSARATSARATSARATSARATSARATSARAISAQATPAQAARASRAVWVTVRPGQTLSGIASAHRLTWQAIYATPPNSRVLRDPDRLTAGERLRLPSDPKLRAAEFKARYAAKLAGDSAAARARATGPQAAAQPGSASDAYSGAGESAFEQCVAWRESSDTPTDPDGLFGILPSTWASLGYSGTAGEASVAVQEQAFAKLYAEDGAAPWAPYDGC